MASQKRESSTKNSVLIEEISLFIQYGINEEEQPLAVDTAKKFYDNSLVLQLLKSFYSQLPECRDEAVSKVSRIVSRQGMYLMLLATKSYEYLFFYDGENSYYLGEKKDGIGEAEVLGFFGYSSNEEFLKQQKNAPESLSGDDEENMGNTFCPACSVAEGEEHELGCPVEICPWCEGQLSYCNCRFDKLGVEEIETDAELDRLEILLNEEGRIPFSRDAGLSYPDDGDKHQ